MLNLLPVTVGLAVSYAAWADANPAPTPIAPGSSLNVTVLGTSSIYSIFGHAGDPGGDYGPDSPATPLGFAAGSGNVFTFSATGLVSCCGQNQTPYIPPDGYPGGMSIGGANGLSSLSGNAYIPLVGVFTTDSDPAGATPPASLSFDANNPTSLSPALDQVFYIGDGRAGYQNAAGAQLQFTAPAGATRLYVGVIDAFGFGGTTGYYNDNAGSFNVNVNLVPEPETAPLLAAGLGLLAWVAKQRRKHAA